MSGYPAVVCECGTPFFWAVSAKTGSAMPVNAEPDPDGNLQITNGWDNKPRATVVSNPALRFGRTMYTSHFASCPRAYSYRSRGRA